MEFWLRIALIQLGHLPKGASTRPRVPYCSPKQSGLATLLALLLIAVRRLLLTTFSPLPSTLIVTSRPGQKGLMPLLALLLIAIHNALLTTHVLLPSHPSGTLITNTSSSHTHHSAL